MHFLKVCNEVFPKTMAASLVLLPPPLSILLGPGLSELWAARDSYLGLGFV